MSLEVGVIADRLREYRVPEDLVSQIRWAMNMRIYLAGEVEQLKQRLEELRPYLPAEIANPPAPEIATRRRSKWD